MFNKSSTESTLSALWCFCCQINVCVNDVRTEFGSGVKLVVLTRKCERCIVVKTELRTPRLKDNDNDVMSKFKMPS